MAEGDRGRWVWQPPQQRPPRPQPRAPQQGYHNQRGPPPLQPPGQQQRRGGGNQGGGRGRYQQQQAAEQTQESEAEEENKHHLTKEMIEQMSAKRNLLEELSKCAEDEEKPKETKKQKKQQMWGPILPCRKSSRNVEDGRTVMEKAQSNIKHKNLEKPAKHGRLIPKIMTVLKMVKGHKWTRIQELELGIARTLRRWRLLIKAENVEKMDEIAGKWQKQAMEKSVIYDREWWVEHQSVRPRAQIESSFASNVVLMSQLENSVGSVSQTVPLDVVENSVLMNSQGLPDNVVLFVE
ncbi:hypothetical protein EJB05_42302, partial [Eragrostis curvula]